jgi:hypothetical protein
MGIKQYPDFAQEFIEEVVQDKDEREVHIEDVGMFNNRWEEHLRILEKVLM